MLECMGAVSKDYAPGKGGAVSYKQTTKTVAELTQVEEEALLYWNFSSFEETWTEQLVRKLKHKRDNEGKSPSRPKKKHRGEHASRVKAKHWNLFVSRIRASRGDRAEGGDWDDALMQEAQRRHHQLIDEMATGGNSDGSGNLVNDEAAAFAEAAEDSTGPGGAALQSSDMVMKVNLGNILGSEFWEV